MKSGPGGFVEGMRRVAGMPMIVLMMWLVNLAAAMLIGLASRDTLTRLFMTVERTADVPAAAFSPAWWAGYAAQANAVSMALTSGASVTSALGDASVPSLISGESLMVMVAIGGWLIARAILWGGILHRYARGTATAPLTFFAACRVFAGRMLRAGLIAGVAYVLLYEAVDFLSNALPNDLLSGIAGAAVTATLVVSCSLVLLTIDLLVDLACVRTILEDRRSVLGAYLAAWRLATTRLRTIGGLYVITTVALLLWIAVRIVTVPSAMESRASGLGTVFLADQVFAFGELALSLVPTVALIGVYRDTLTKELS